ncbi:MAG: recombinase family protein [Ktedonobacteraceae bacterium]
MFTKEIPKQRKRAIIYCRVSTDKQEQDGESLDYQEEKCRQYAEIRDIDVLMVLKEAKSGFIHYSHRDQLTLARQFIRDRMADVIIVWDLRRFSRNFVHSAMIFKEIESNGAEIVSVSENIDNSLTGKLIRSILAWSAESEREKILEYANRHWQTRLEHNLPVGTGRAPYGWAWGDKDKTFYEVNHEEAAVRYSVFHMFVEMDMSIRGIAHKLTEDGILPPAKSRGADVKGTAWHPSTIHMLLTDVANIGVLVICKNTSTLSPQGKVVRRPNGSMKTIHDGLPAIVPVELYELAQIKLKANKSDKSHIHRKPEDFLLKGHIYCKTCNYRMHGRYQTSRNEHVYAYYACAKHRNKYDACPDLTVVRTNNVDQLVWEDCCRVFERLDAIRSTLEGNIEQSLQSMLEDTTGKLLIVQLTEEIAYAKQERAKHAEGSYYYRLISQDIRDKEEQLAKHEEQYCESQDIVKLSHNYRKRILGFLDFLNVMKGKYQQATFTEKRNALDVLGVKVYIHPETQELPLIQVETDHEWLTVGKASELTGINKNTLYVSIHNGVLKAENRGDPLTVLHRDEVIKYLRARRRPVNLDEYEDEWFTINKLVTSGIANYRPLHRAIRRQIIKPQTVEANRPFIHREELNRFLRASPVRPKTTRESLQSRIGITYTPIFTDVQSFFG